MSGGGSAPAGNTTTTQNSEPWSAQQPYLEQGFQSAQDIFNKGAPSYYPGQTVAPVSADTTQAQNLTAQRAISGSPVTQAADRNITDTLNGGYLNSNPYLDDTYNHAAGQVRSGIDSQFEAGGRYGSGAHAGQVASAYGNLANQVYGGNYQNERNNQLRAALLAPAAANQDYTDLGMLGQVGAQQQQQSQDVINADVNKYNYNTQAPLNSLANYMNMIKGSYGGSQTTTQPYYKNDVGLAGGALAGGALGFGLGGGLLAAPGIGLGALYGLGSQNGWF